MFRAEGGAIIGSTMATAIPPITFMFLIWEGSAKASAWQWLAFLVISLAAIVGGLWLGQPYRRAYRAVTTRTAKVRRRLDDAAKGQTE